MMGLEQYLPEFYPDTFGRIKCLEGYHLACATNKTPNLSSYFKYTKKPEVIKLNSLDEARDLAYLLLQIKDTRPDDIKSAWQNLAQQKPFSLYSTSDKGFFRIAMGMCLDEKRCQWFESIPRKYAEDLVCSLEGKKVRGQLSELYSLATDFIDSVPIHTIDAVGDNEITFLLFASGLQALRKKLGEDFRAFSASNAQVYRHHVVKHSPESNEMANEEILAGLNYSAQCATINNLPGCCITDGESRDASILYWLDPVVHLWQICNTDDFYGPLTFGLGIFVEAEGHHVSTPDSNEKYLVMEGFPVNNYKYSTINSVQATGNHMLAARDLIKFPQSLYVLGLVAARALNIPRVFVNTEHRGQRRSVEDVVREAAICSKQPEDIWDINRHRQFQLLKDPYTNGSFALLTDSSEPKQIVHDANGQPFQYTHFLKKRKQFPADLITELRRDPSWNGEGFFDTWYGWNKFIMETYPQWSEELRKQHPYAESVWKHGKDPQWNLGIGYCKGFEVDVEKECKRLGIS